MEANKEISLKIKELAKIRRKIRQNKVYAFRLSLEDPQDFDSNPFQDEIEFLKLQEIYILQEIQYLKNQIRNSVHPLFFQNSFSEAA
ncbi:MAG: hypothetical protein ACUVTB_06635 [Candidatus Bathycorpusculaceae bacterium]